jgi:hypothetical protein
MTERSVTMHVDSEDGITTNLARILLVTEIAAQVLACFIVLEMIEHGGITYKIAWHWQKLRRRYESQLENERGFKRSLGRMLYEVDQIEKGSTNGRT